MSRRILIVDATATNRIALKAVLSAARYDSVSTSSGAEGLASIRVQAPDTVLVNGKLPDMTCAEFCNGMKVLLGDSMPPVIAMLDDCSPQDRLEVLQAGADKILTHPVDRGWVLTNLRALLRSHETLAELKRRIKTASQLGFADDSVAFQSPSTCLAIVSSDRTRMATISRSLREHGQHNVRLMSPEAAIVAADDTETAPELFVLSPGTETEDCLSLIAELRTRRGTRRAAILVEYDPADRVFAARALDQGVSDLLRDDCCAQERMLRIDRQLKAKRCSDALRAAVDASLILAAHDPLTGLFNRRYALRYLKDLSNLSHSGGRGCGQLLLDVDFFKSINDTHGHAAGDFVLKQIASRLLDNVREGDLLARFGGEEFLVALPDCSLDEARIAGERLRAAIAGAPVSLPDGSHARVTLSVGAVCGEGDPDRMLEQADGALYRAKGAGRNRVVAVEYSNVRPDTDSESSSQKTHLTDLPQSNAI